MSTVGQLSSIETRDAAGIAPSAGEEDATLEKPGNDGNQVGVKLIESVEQPDSTKPATRTAVPRRRPIADARYTENIEIFCFLFSDFIAPKPWQPQGYTVP